MATQTNTNKKSNGKTQTPPPAALATIDQVLDASAAAGQAGDKKLVQQARRMEQEEAITRVMTNQQALAAAFEKLETAKEDEWQEGAADFWKPEAPNDSIRGIYLGYVTEERYKVHGIAVKDEDGKMVAVRVNGTRILSSELSKGDVGQPVDITYLGEETKTVAGEDGQAEIRRIKRYRVRWL